MFCLSVLLALRCLPLSGPRPPWPMFRRGRNTLALSHTTLRLPILWSWAAFHCLEVSRGCCLSFIGTHHQHPLAESSVRLRLAFALFACGFQETGPLLPPRQLSRLDKGAAMTVSGRSRFFRRSRLASPSPLPGTNRLGLQAPQ